MDSDRKVDASGEDSSTAADIKGSESDSGTIPLLSPLPLQRHLKLKL